MPPARARMFEWAADARDRVAVPFTEIGSGPTLLLLPSFSTVSTREEMLPLASRLAGEHRVVIPDWPGFGDGRHRRLPHAPALHMAFLDAFAREVTPEAACVVAAGHAAGYALSLARARPQTVPRLALLAPTWRGPLPTMMDGYRPLQDRLHAAIRMPILGHALYRLNVARPVIAMMYRRHVYADPARLTPELLARKARIARRPGGRFGSGAFVTGGLDIVRDRAAFVALATGLACPLLLIYGRDTPPKSRADMEALAGLAGVRSRRMDRGALGIHEEFADAIADEVIPFVGLSPRSGGSAGV